ncbi:MAG: sulfatase-like hydrolase/transferase, partial [Chloroflexi bacterium]|nr:sulfatase-like hydrolase/transferase [Chloroflexota bacterium]
MSKFSRRDFMKFTVAASGTLALSKFIPQTSWTKINQSASLPNVLIFVFDAMSAKNLSVYGYPRKTSPNLERFAERATVFNAHYSAGSFTTPGTASLLTGLYPWTHRAINEAGLIARDLTERNIFKLTGEDRYRVAYSQNIWPNYFFGQFQQDIDKIISPGSFGQVDYLIGEKFDKSLQTNLRAFDDFLFQSENPPASLVFGLIERILFRRTVTLTNQGGYPNGLPRLSDYPLYFRLQDVFDGVIKSIENLNPSYMAYFHFWPPHDPYNPTKQFYR